MRWKSETTIASQETAQRSGREARLEKISVDLQARGVAADAAAALAELVEASVEAQDPAAYAATLDHVALGFRARGLARQDPGQTATELQEIERLMASFAGELSKLDEVLEVLAAYLRRMRSVLPANSSTILH